MHFVALENVYTRTYSYMRIRVHADVYICACVHVCVSMCVCPDLAMLYHPGPNPKRALIGDGAFRTHMHAHEHCV